VILLQYFHFPILFFQVNRIGHVIRREGLLREVIEGRMIGKRGPGRPRVEMLGELLEKDTWSYEKKDRRSVGLESW